MKEVQVSKGLKTVIKDVPIPEPGPEQLVIKVIVSGSNPKDWYVFPYFSYSLPKIITIINRDSLLKFT